MVKKKTRMVDRLVFGLGITTCLMWVVGFAIPAIGLLAWALSLASLLVGAIVLYNGGNRWCIIGMVLAAAPLAGLLLLLAAAIVFGTVFG